VHGLGVGWWLVSAVMSVYAGVEAVVPVGMVCGRSGDFEVGVGVCQGLA